MKKNRYIELCRFLSALVIFFHHTYYVGLRLSFGGWIMVEYFYLLTGYFTAKHFAVSEADRTPEKTAFLYTIRKIRHLLPYAATGVVLSALQKVVSGEIQPTNLKDLLAELPLHLLMLKNTGFLHFDLDGALWFVTDIVLVLPPLITLLLKKRDFTRYYLSWALPILCYLILYAWHGQLYYFSSGVIIHLLIRGAAALFLGVGLYYLSLRLSTLSLRKPLATLLPGLEVLLYLVLVLMTFNTDFTTSSIAYLFWMMVSLCITFSGKGIRMERLPGWTLFLGKLSIPLFCVHIPVMDWVQYLMPDAAFGRKLFLSLTISLAVSAILVLLQNRKSRPAEMEKRLSGHHN